LMMPNFDGIKMLQVKNVLKDIQNIPVLVISANTAKRNVMAALEAGAHRVISKPLDQQLIIKYVNEILGGGALSESNVKNQLNDNDKFEIKRNVLKFFIDSFDIKRRMISDALKRKDAEKLKTVIHEIKGAGGTIGYPELTNISKEIEEKEFKLTTDWVFAEMKCDRLFKEVQQIEKEFNNN
ncbi:MAG: response regulator, partial [Melioribacteraceae bacterium]